MFEFDPKTHTYTLDGKPMTGCTTILGVLAKPALIQWAANEAVNHIKKWLENPSTTKVTYETVMSILEEARTAHAKFRDKRAKEGTDTHSLIEEWVKLCIKEHEGKPLATWRADTNIKPFVEWAQKEEVTFLASEARFYSKSLFVAGTADLLFEKKGQRFVGDVKNKKKIYGRESYFQCAGYQIMAQEMGEKPFDGYCIIRVWEDQIETLWGYDVEGDMEAFRACVTIYRALNK